MRKYIGFVLLLCSAGLFAFAHTFVDAFDDDIIDSTVWSIQASENTHIAEFGGVCRMRINHGGCGGLRVCNLTKRMKECVIGDFDVYVKFEAVAIGDGDITPFMLQVTNDCVRQKVSVSWAAHYGRFSYRLEMIDTTAADTIWTIVSSSVTWEREGYLRLRRSGDRFTGYYYEDFWGGWTEIGSVDMEMNNTWLAMHIQNQGSHETIDVAVDSFHLQYDSMYYSECDPPVPVLGCMNETAVLSLVDPDGIYPPSIRFTIDGMPYRYDSPGVTFDGRNLEYDPAGSWADGSVHTFCLNHVEDMIGNARTRDTCWTFVTDFTAPGVSEFSPEPLEILYTYSPVVSCRIVDRWHEVDISRSSIRINTFNFFLGDPRIDWTGTHAYVDLERIGLSLRPGDSVSVCIHAFDEIPYCTPNDSLVCWSFFTADSIRPVIGDHFPTDTLISSCYDQYVSVVITDNIEVEPTTISLSAGGNTYHYPDQMDYVNDTLYFFPDFSWVSGLNEVCILAVEDTWENSAPDLPHCFNILIDLDGPIYDNLTPPPGAVVSTTHPEISCIITDIISEVSVDSFAVIFNDSIEFRLDPSSELYTFDGDLFIFDSELAGLHFSGGNDVEVCIHAFDVPDLCEPNLGDTCWVFSVAEGGPIAYEILPLRNEHTSCADQEIRIIIEDEDGVNWSNVILSVAGERYYMDDDELSHSGDTLIFNPSSLFDHAQVVQVYLANAQDMLDNPLSEELVYSFVVDLLPPTASLISPVPDQIVRSQQPVIEIAVMDDTTPILPDSTIISVLDSVFTMSHPAMRFRSSDGGLRGMFTIDLSLSGLRLFSGDTVWVRTVRLCDDPDHCDPNCGDSVWFFRQEHDRDCVAWPNPFTPNNDMFNDIIFFEYPGQDLDNAELVIYDLRGFEVIRKKIPASINEYEISRAWDGLSAKGQLQKQGTYIYMILVDGEVVCDGSITLVR